MIKNVLYLFFFIGLCAKITAQQDSTAIAIQDSLAQSNLEYSERIITAADSLHLSDSLQQQALLKQIEELRASDTQRKEELKAQLDSLTLAQQERNTRIKRQVDSLKTKTPGIPVTVFNDTIFFVHAKLGPFSASDRAKTISKKIEMLVDEHLYDEEKFRILENEESVDLIHDDLMILSVTSRDAFWLDKSPLEVVNDYQAAIIASIEAYKDNTSLWTSLKRIGLLLFVLVVLFIIIKFTHKGFTWFNQWLLKKGKRFINGVKLKNYEFLSQEREEQLLRWLLKMLKWFFILIVVYLTLPVVFSIFPATTGMASTLLGYVLDPLKAFGVSVLGYIPEMITIVVILFLTRYFVKFLKFLASEVETGKLQLPGFYPDWANPTYNLLKIIIYAFSFVMIFPYLPGSDSDVFKGVSVFLGILFSLGSSSAISNIIAGLVITYMRAFKIGERVKIGDTVGDVVEKTMLVTRLRTIKNEDVTIPNSSILNGNTVNYSSSAQSRGLILSSTVTIGYDVPWRNVHELLISAALKTDHVKQEPKPFVLQTSLDDFYVSYQINAYTDQAGIAAKIYSQLHANIQDAFNEGDVEILSPHYRAVRDGNMITIPADYLPPDYKVPNFNIKVNKDKE